MIGACSGIVSPFVAKSAFVDSAPCPLPLVGAGRYDSKDCAIGEMRFEGMVLFGNGVLVGHGQYPRQYSSGRPKCHNGNFPGERRQAPQRCGHADTARFGQNC